MKKVLVLMLVALMAVSCVLLVACNVSVTEIKIKNAPSEVTRGAQIDYSTISIEVTYDDGTTKTLALTDKGVSYNPIDTSTTGPKTLAVRYGSKSAQVTITVVAGSVQVENVIVTEFNNTKGYNAYVKASDEQTNKETEFAKLKEPYKVGTANGYKFVPVVTVLDENADEVPLPEAQIATTYKLFIKEGSSFRESAAHDDSYLSKVENNVYYFKAEAEGETFKLVVSLAAGFELIDDQMATSVEQTFQVVDGYNVYDALGLSVLDNLNVKSWANLKTHKYDWDNGKSLAEFTDVKQVILHNNITITTQYLPANYFWQDGEEARYGGVSFNDANNAIAADHPLKGYLEGSIKEIPLGEDWELSDGNEYRTSLQRGLYVSDGIGLSGNYLTIGYEANYNTNGDNGLYIVYDYSKKGKNDYPEGHWSVIRYQQANETLNYSATIENVYFIGETGKTENLKLPTGLMTMSSNLTTTTVNNTIATSWYSNFVLDAVDEIGYGTFNVTDSKLYNSFSSMVFSRRMAEINVTNSEMKKAGGPLFIIHTRTSDGDDGVTNTVLNIDSTANMESWLSGGEMWFEVNNLEASDIMQLTTVASMVDTVEGSGTHYRRATSGEDFQINIIAVVIPNPSKVFENRAAIKGTINVGEYQYGMEEALYSSVLHVSSTANTGAALAQQTIDDLGAYLSDYVTALGALKAGFESLASATAMLPYAPMYKCGNTFAYANGSITNLTMNSLASIYNGITKAPSEDENSMSLYQGVKLVISTLASKIEDPNYASAVEKLTQLKAGWEAVKAGLDPIALSGFNANTWASSWTAGQLACWINPAAMGESSNVHFMILLGEDKAA